ncbi:hypothetical protein H2198_005250 [Neophaeococcomyces mojaviensis]|uniref:Uncharacterized protein n=1 Tax=Neophaeococcomyces mojaviensis TaxID=3383035 RepID=A0ACC3A690_9EURO|nr:hypothetical protein H2198_005250 [Knufia sp. JES_112]
MSLEKYYESPSAEHAISGLIQAVELMKPRLPTRKNRLVQQSLRTPKTSLERRQATCNDSAFDDLHNLSATGQEDDTVLYLGYGSNLAAETFLGRRGIRPLSQVNIVAPAISLTFDLPGIAYSEPCFGNCRYRPTTDNPDHTSPPYHKNAWKKGLVGVVYEVTKKDYAHIIATEGGGSGYHDVLVDCYELDSDPSLEVPTEPTGTPFKAHTLYAHRAKALRPDPDYAQPSARYLKLITDGAEEHQLPAEYRHFLKNIRTYHATTIQQQLGSFVFLSVWAPLFLFFFGGGKIFLRRDGTYPKWFAVFSNAVFTACWASYDGFFQPLFGDGERTIGDDLDKGEGYSAGVESEKTPLLRKHDPSSCDQV